jgi:hypothetical protein
MVNDTVYIKHRASGKTTKYETFEEEQKAAETIQKKCIKCGEELPLTNFSTNTSSSCHFDKNHMLLRRGDCFECNKKQIKGQREAKKLAKKIGKQKPPEGQVCEICNKTTNIVFDHNHNTNIFRGWLCNTCNISLGSLGDSVKGLIKAINYLQKNEQLNIAMNEKKEIILLE